MTLTNKLSLPSIVEQRGRERKERERKGGDSMCSRSDGVRRDANVSMIHPYHVVLLDERETSV